MESEKAEIPEFDPSADWRTLQTAFDESLAANEISYGWADAIDGKIVAVFTLATAIAGVFPIGHPKVALSIGSISGLVVGFLGWMAAVFFCWRGYAPRGFKLGPSPQALLEGNWLGRSLANYQWYRLHYLGLSFDQNTEACEAKARDLGSAMLATALEVLMLSVVRFTA